MFAFTVIFHLLYQRTYQMPLTSVSAFLPSGPFSCPGLFAFIYVLILVMIHSFTYLFIPRIFNEKLQDARNCFSSGTTIESNTTNLCYHGINQFHGINSLVQGSANCVLWATSGPPCKYSFIGTQPHTFTCGWSVATFNNSRVESSKKSHGP